jgi:putative spermidine/putrescine transport system substrate-binding protein
MLFQARIAKGYARVVIVAALLTLTLTSCQNEPRTGTPQAPPKVVRLVSWGGFLQEDLVGKWITPAAKGAGIRVEAQTWNGDMGALATRIRRSVNTWDLVHVELQDAFRPDGAEIFEGFRSRNLGDLEDSYREASIVKDGLGMPNYEWGYVLAYRTDRIASGGQPLTWDALWNTRRYPGRRGIRNWPIGAIEIALLSLNRDPRHVLYDQKLSREQIEKQVTDALDRLNLIREYTTFWDTGDQVQRGLTSGDMVFTAGYTGRTGTAFQKVCPSATDISSPCAVAVNPATAIVGADWWIIPKGAANAATANALLEAMYSGRAINGATAFSSNRGYHVPMKGVHVSDSIVKAFVEMGSSRNKNALHIDSRFWSANFTWIMDRWRLWKSQR